MSLSATFARLMGEQPVEAGILDEVGLDTPCGQECYRAMLAGASLKSHMEMAGADDVDRIAAMVEQTCVIYIRA